MTEQIISPSSQILQYNATLPTLTDGQSGPAQSDARGRTIIVGDGGVPIPTTGGNRSSVTATIANGASLSAAIDLGANYFAVSLTMPAAWTAASLSFQTSVDNVTFNEMSDVLGALVSLTVSASTDLALDGTTFIGRRYIKVRSGTAASPVNQGASRAIILTTVPF